MLPVATFRGLFARIVESCYVSCMPGTQVPNLDLKRERFKQQMNRSTLSRRTHISRKSLIAIEERKTRVRLDTASRIAKALNVSVEDLFELEEVIG